MPRRARVIIPNVPHHIVQRGNNRQNILEDLEDFRNYCYWVNKYSLLYKVSILAYCLMNNHVHFILTPEDKEGLSRMFRTVNMRYAQYKNFKRKTSGHLWQGRFFSCILGKEHLFFAIRYVEQNPVRAKIVQYPWDYEWSSARWHLRKSVRKYIKVDDGAEIIDCHYWKNYLLNVDKEVDDKIRQKTNKGKALASDSFIVYWEHKLQCVLRDLKPGRKGKK